MTLAYYDTIYERLGTDFNYFYFEREAGIIGLELVKEYLKKGVFETSNGAVILMENITDYHTRVFH